MNNCKPVLYWRTPPANILTDTDAGRKTTGTEYTPEQITGVVTSCGVSCHGVGVTVGASVVQYHINLTDLRQYAKMMRTASAVSAVINRAVTVSPSTVGHCAVTVGRAERAHVSLKGTMLTPVFNDLDSPTAAILGRTVDNQPLAIDIAKMPHLLIAGATGSGKSVLLHSIVGSMLFKGTPAKLRFVMIDPKQIELTAYGGLPHLACPIITNVQSAITMLDRVCAIMDNRYRKIRAGYTNHPKLVVIIDELADLMMVSKHAVEPAIVRIAQLGRAAGIHLIVATQRPTVDVVTGLIKSNMPARVALTMASYRDANVVEIKGADKLSGKGDALFQSPDHTQSPVRFQSAFTCDEDIKAIVNHYRRGASPN